MRPTGIAGLVLIVLCVVVLVTGGGFTTKKDILKIGDVKVTADDKQSIPPWVAGVGIIAGIGLLATSRRRS
ncbi:MAG: hypothetical protein V4558_06860 [Gemmatimonadota bacterium]